jgi:hypothetical protein
MTVKLFEVRDRATFIPVVAVQVTATEGSEDYLLMSSGFSDSSAYPSALVGMALLAGGQGVMYFFHSEWGDRTLSTAHQYIADNFDNLKSGQVIDVEFILGEVDRPKKSQRGESYGEG